MQRSSYKLKELVTKIDYGYTAKATDQDTGIKFLRITDITQGSLNWLNVPFCEISEESSDKYQLYEDDIVIARTGASVGSAKQIRNLDHQSVFASYLIRIRPSEDVDPHYLGVILESDIYQNWVLGISSGSAQPNANAQMLVDFDVPLPPINTQRRIGVIARNIDDLIENNQRRIEILEESTKALYREWFVHYRYPGHENDTMVDSELGPIPKGWEITTLEEGCSLERVSLNPQKTLDETFTYFSLPAFDEGRKPEIVLGAEIKSSKYLLQGDCVLLSKLNPRFPRVWWAAPFLKTHRAICSSEFLPLIANKDWPLPFIYSMVSSDQFVKMLAVRANGTSGSHQRIQPDDLMNISVISPPTGVIQAFEQKTYKNLETIGNLITLKGSLANIRDLLLPRLISGELDVSDLDLVA